MEYSDRSVLGFAPGGSRLAFVPAMPLTQRVDGEVRASYLELVDLLVSRGAST